MWNLLSRIVLNLSLSLHLFLCLTLQPIPISLQPSLSLQPIPLSLKPIPLSLSKASITDASVLHLIEFCIRCSLENMPDNRNYNIIQHNCGTWWCFG